MAGAGQERQNFAHVVDEAHVEHAVGLVEYRRAKVAQVERAALEQVFEPAGRADDKRRLAAQLAHLRVDVGAADTHGAVDAEPLGKPFELIGNLQRKLPSRDHDQHAVTRRNQNFIDERNKKGRRFAGAGVGDADDILAAQNVWDGAVLNRRGERVAFGYDIALEPCIDCKIAELVLRVKNLCYLGNNRLVDKLGDVRKRRSLAAFLSRAAAPAVEALFAEMRLTPAKTSRSRAMRARLRREPRGSFMEP